MKAITFLQNEYGNADNFNSRQLLDGLNAIEQYLLIDLMDKFATELANEADKSDEKCTLPVVNVWVAVDTPPKVDYFYLAYDQDLCRITKALFDGEWHPNEDDVTVTHWMELPEPPLR